MAGRFLRNEGSSANPAFMWCRRLELGAHQAWCPLLHALFKAANTLPALRTNATVSAIQGTHFQESDLAGKRRRASESASDYFPHQDAARPSDLLKTLGQELREHYELPHDLPHGMFTLLMELSDRGGNPALRTRADKYRAIAERA